MWPWRQTIQYGRICERLCRKGDHHITNGITAIIESSRVSEEQMNRFCSNAVYMEVCIVITESSYRSLRCPRLQELRPCQPGCSDLENVDDIDAIVRQCSGQPIIATRPGLELRQSLTELQINRLFSEAVEVRMCLKVESSDVKSLSAVIEGNPLLSKSQIDIIQNVCLHCMVEYEAPACGIRSGQITAKMLVNACAGKKIIKPNSAPSVIYSLQK
ncbi:hypothetical protein OSTOST_23134 [Ostertagia ostertagi]